MELQGKTILTTRAASQSKELREQLEAAGARVLECPAIEIVPVADWTEVDQAIAALHTYDWVIFTSTNAVEFFMNRVAAKNVQWQVPIAAVGTATAGRLSQWNVKASRVPADFRAEGLLSEFGENLAGTRILIPRAEKGRELLPETLRERGAEVDLITVYRTVKPRTREVEIRETLLKERIDAIVFTSPSAVRFVSDELEEDMHQMLSGVPVAVIGPVAAEAVRSVDLEPAIEPSQATIPALVQAIKEYFSSPEQNT